MVQGIALLSGGLLWAAMHFVEWRRWRAGKPSRLPWLGWSVLDAPRNEMNRLVEAASMMGNVVLGLAVAVLGFALAFAQ